MRMKSGPEPEESGPAPASTPQIDDEWLQKWLSVLMDVCVCFGMLAAFNVEVLWCWLVFGMSLEVPLPIGPNPCVTYS